jgi:hypothetical protein
MKFQLYEDVKVATWRRYTYEVEAETLEEAVELVKDGDADCIDMEDFYNADDYMSPQENGGQATHEIYSAGDDVLLYSNKGECTSLMGEMGL